MADAHVPHVDHEIHDDHQPTERQYWIVFAALVVFTALEVAWSFMGLSGPALVLPLVVMMVVKFLLVAGVFMHLYFDMKIGNGRLYALAFGGALALAGFLYLVVFGSFAFNISGAY